MKFEPVPVTWSIFDFYEKTKKSLGTYCILQRQMPKKNHNAVAKNKTTFLLCPDRYAKSAKVTALKLISHINTIVY
jgi:hypothetical protein